MSPIANHRPGFNTARVASSSRQYPIIRYGLRTWISPSTPSGTGWPSVSRISSAVVAITRPAEVGWAHDRAEADGRPEADHPLGTVRREQRNTVAAAHPVLLAEHVRECRHALEVVGKSDPLVIEDEVLELVPLGRLDEEFARGTGSVLEDRHALAEHQLFDHLERGPGTGQVAGWRRGGHGIPSSPISALQQR